MLNQPHLFPMPKANAFDLTPMQWRVMDWVAFNECGMAAYPAALNRETLRRLIQKRMVEVIGYSPARYRLTALGRVVRSSHGNGKRRAPLLTGVLFRDPAED